MADPNRLDRQNRRAEAAQRQKVFTQARPLPVDPDKLDEIGSTITVGMRAMLGLGFGLPKDGDGPAVCAVDDPRNGWKIFSLEPIWEVLITFLTARVFEHTSIPCRVVVGSAMWSAGRGDRDLLGHGSQASLGPEQDAAHGNYYAWLDIDGHLVDVTARMLRTKFSHAARIEPFSTHPSRWRRFPTTIVHPRGAAMPDPLHRREAAYRYCEGTPELGSAVRERVVPMLSEADAFIANFSGR